MAGTLVEEGTVGTLRWSVARGLQRGVGGGREHRMAGSEVKENKIILL